MNKNYIRFITIGMLFLGIFISSSALSCTLTMGYRSSERLPLIKKEPDNSGLYYDLYKQAAKQIGCQFQVVRGSKKRILKMLKKGLIDFYPGLNFTPARSEFSYYIENGLPGGDMGISRMDMPEITALHQLQGYTLLAALGAPFFSREYEQIRVHKVREMTVDKAITMIKLKRGDFYIYNKSTLEYYLLKHQIGDIKRHPDCCGGVQPLYLGFSRKSVHFQENDNPKYDRLQPLAVDNFPSRLKTGTIAYQLQQALKEMQENGKTDALYKKYYVRIDIDSTETPSER